MKPDVSVIIPTYRRPQAVVEAVRSVLAQEGVSAEVVVIDDSPEGSAEEAVQAINDPRVHYHKVAEPSGGKPAIVRNNAVREAQGRYLHFLDDDDHLAPGALHAMVTALDGKPGAGVAFGWVCPFGNDPVELKNKADYFARAAQIAKTVRWRYRAVATILFRGTLMVNSACMIRRSEFESVGGFDPSIPVYEDVEFWMRSIRKLGHVFVDRPILEYRTGEPSLMHDLHGDGRPVREAYRIMHAKYRAAHGIVEYAFLKVLASRIPIVAPS